MSKKGDTYSLRYWLFFATALLAIPGAMLISLPPHSGSPFAELFNWSELGPIWKRLRCFPLPLNGAPYPDVPTMHGRP